MRDIGKVVEVLAREGVAVAGQIVAGDVEEAPILISVVVSRDQLNRQSPSNRKLEAIRDELAEQGVRVEFLLRYGDFDDIEIALRSTLLHSHIDSIRNVFMSIDPPEASVWVEPKSNLDLEIISEIESRARKFLSLFDLRLASLALTVEAPLPPLLVILNSVRSFSPASPEDLKKDLEEKGFTIPSPDWLARKLDVMRKEGRIVRLPSGGVVLSTKSLQQLGTSKDSGSPDVRRVLALARRHR